MLSRLVASLVVLALSTSTVSAQSVGLCPTSYQTSMNFTQAFVNKMVKPDTSYILVLSNSVGERCQVFNLTTTQQYSYSFIPRNTNVTTNFTNAYTFLPWKLTESASLTFNTGTGLFGSGPLSSRETMYPIVANDDFIVFYSCQQQYLIQRQEKVSVWMRQPYTGTPTRAALKALLTSSGVTQFATLTEVDTNCTSELRSAVPATPPATTPNLLQFITGALGQQGLGNLGNIGGINPAVPQAVFSPQAAGAVLPPPAVPGIGPGISGVVPVPSVPGLRDSLPATAGQSAVVIAQPSVSAAQPVASSAIAPAALSAQADSVSNDVSIIEDLAHGAGITSGNELTHDEGSLRKEPTPVGATEDNETGDELSAVEILNNQVSSAKKSKKKNNKQ